MAFRMKVYYPRVEGAIGLHRSTRKMIRGLLYSLIMGIVAIVAIMEGGVQAGVIAGLFIMGALLVFGIDIRRITWGSLQVDFESDLLPASDGGGEDDTGGGRQATFGNGEE